MNRIFNLNNHTIQTSFKLSDLNTSEEILIGKILNHNDILHKMNELIEIEYFEKLTNRNVQYYMIVFKNFTITFEMSRVYISDTFSRWTVNQNEDIIDTIITN